MCDVGVGLRMRCIDVGGYGWGAGGKSSVNEEERW